MPRSAKPKYPTMVVRIAHIPYSSGPNSRMVKGVIRNEVIAAAPLAATLQIVPRTTVVSTPDVWDGSALGEVSEAGVNLLAIFVSAMPVRSRANQCGGCGCLSSGKA